MTPPSSETNAAEKPPARTVAWVIQGALVGACVGALAQVVELAFTGITPGRRDLVFLLAAASWVGAVPLGTLSAALAVLRPSALGWRAMARMAAALFVALVGYGFFWVWLRDNADAVRVATALAFIFVPLVTVAAALAMGELVRRTDRLPLPAVASGACLALLVAATVVTWPYARVGQVDPNPPPAGNSRSAVLIVLDTTRADALEPYGGEPGSTPFVAALADESTVFEQVISTSPWTLPSHASMFTGLYPRTHACWFGERRWLDEVHETLGERYQAASFETAALISNGYLNAANLLQGFDLLFNGGGGIDALILGELMAATGVGPERWIDKGSSEILSRLDRWLRMRDPERPFFLFVNLLEPHDPFQPPWRDRRLPQGSSLLRSLKAQLQYDPVTWQSLAREEGPDEDVMRSFYAGEVRYQDRLLAQIVGRLDAQLGKEGYDLLITADHGENLGAGGRWGHFASLSDALIHIPLIVRAPSFGRGERVAEAFSVIDIGPTMLELSGLPSQLGEGRSLSPSSRRPRAWTFAEVYPNYLRLHRTRNPTRQGLGHARLTLTAIRGDGFKLVVPSSGPSLLYDLARDPDEKLDLSSMLSERKAGLSAELERWLQAHPKVEVTGEVEAGQALDDETRRRLEALGYL